MEAEVVNVAVSTGMTAMEVLKVMIPIWLLVLSWLLRTLWGTFTTRIEGVECGLNLKHSKSDWEMEKQLLSNKLEFLERQFDDSVTRNSLEHGELKAVLKEMADDQKLNTKALSKINTCIARLSEKISKQEGTA